MDTSFIIELFRCHSIVEKLLPEIDRDGVKTSAITVYEVLGEGRE